MIRLFIFILGLGSFLLGAASNYPSIPVPIDSRSITFTISEASLTLDVLLMIVGVFLMVIAWIFHRLAQ